MSNFSGGKEVIERIKKAYGFTKQIDLAKHLSIPQSTFATWGSRGIFPAELVIRCVIETGARLEYVARGIEPIFDDSMNMKYFQSFNLESGKLFINENKPFLLPLLPNLDSRESYDHLFCVSENNRTFFINPNYDTLTDGEYFVLVENSHLIRYLTVLPGGKVRVDGGKFSFECDLVDIEIKGKVILKMEKS